MNGKYTHSALLLRTLPDKMLISRITLFELKPSHSDLQAERVFTQTTDGFGGNGGHPLLSGDFIVLARKHGVYVFK